MADHGYIKFYRSALNHPFFRDDAEKVAWLWLLCEAGWKPYRRRIGEFYLQLDRGEVVGAVRFLADEWGWSKSKVERFLNRLKIEGMIETRTETGITIITVCNYNIYQGDADDDGTVSGHEPGHVRDAVETAPGQRRDNREEIKHSRREEGEEDLLGCVAEPPGSSLVPATKSAKRPRAPRIAMTPDWSAVGEDWQYALDRGFTSQTIPIEEERFRLHFLKTGDKRPGWSHSWKAWILKALEIRAERAARNGSVSQGARPNRADSAVEGMFSDLTQEDFVGRSR